MTHVTVAKAGEELDESIPEPTRDPLTGGLLRPLDYAETLARFKAMNSRADGSWRRDNRMGASDLGGCLRESMWKRTGEAKDDGARGFDDGLGERGNAIEDRQTMVYRETHDPDAVLQNVRLSKVIQLFDPRAESEGKPFAIAITSRTDPLVIGDNLKPLQLWEIKTKDLRDWFGKVMSRWGDPRDEDTPRKVPLHMVGIEEGPDKGASLHNLMQIAMEARILKENGLPPTQVVLHYVYPGRTTEYVTIVLSETDIAVLSELGILWTRQFFHFFLQNKLPPPLWTMSWQCGYCDWKNKCALLNKQNGEERAMNPIFADVNGRLDRARKMKPPADLLAAREAANDAKLRLQTLETTFHESLVSDLPVSGLFTAAAPVAVKKKGAK